MNSDNGYDKKTHTLTAPSNATRFARALNSRGHEGEAEILQLVYYQAGVGSSDNW
jgi:hypothetical protein